MQPSIHPSRPEAFFLNLTRPLVFFDLETTGIMPLTDRIVEIYAVRHHPDGREEELHYYLNPTIPIPEGATAVHGITNAMVADKPSFADEVEELAGFFSDCDLAGYNIKKYDVPLLLEEFGRCKKYPINYNEVKLVDAMGIYHNKEKRDLSAAVKFYLDKEHDGAHSAKADVQATINILKKQLLLYEDLNPNTSFLNDFTHAGNTVDPHWKFIRDEEGKIVLNFGKHKGVEACTQPDYLKWMFTDGDFAVATKMVAKKIYMLCKWEQEIKQWLTSNQLLENFEVASALYATAASGEGIYPFSIQRENESLTITHQANPPSSCRLQNKDATQILLQLLDARIRQQNGSEEVPA